MAVSLVCERGVSATATFTLHTGFGGAEVGGGTFNCSNESVKGIRAQRGTVVVSGEATWVDYNIQVATVGGEVFGCIGGSELTAKVVCAGTSSAATLARSSINPDRTI